MAFKRLPNNYGTVTKLSGNRRKPFCARKRIGTVYDDDTMTAHAKYVVIGYYTTKAEALKALANSTASTDAASAKFSDVWEGYCEEYLIRHEYVPRSYSSSYRKHLKVFHNRRFSYIKPSDIDLFFKNTEIARTMVKYVRQTLINMYDYAIRHEIVDKNYAEAVIVDTDNDVKIKRRVFTPEEVTDLFNTKELWSDFSLILCYSGMRYIELQKMPISDTHIEERYFYGGVKTDAGKERIIPMHKAIIGIVRKYYDDAVKNGRKYLFKELSGSSYSRIADDLKDYVDHTTHDARHTFVTAAKKIGMDEALLHKIIGHADNLTNTVYMHYSVEEMLEQVDKISLCKLDKFIG